MRRAKAIHCVIQSTVIHFPPPDGLGLVDTLGAPSLGRYDVIISPLPSPLLIASDVTIMNGVVFHLRFFNVAHKQDASLPVSARHDAGLPSRKAALHNIWRRTFARSCAHRSISPPSTPSVFCRVRRILPHFRGLPNYRITSCKAASLPSPKQLQGNRILYENFIATYATSRPGRRHLSGLRGARRHLIILTNTLDPARVMSVSNIHSLHSKHLSPNSTALRAR